MKSILIALIINFDKNKIKKRIVINISEKNLKPCLHEVEGVVGRGHKGGAGDGLQAGEDGGEGGPLVGLLVPAVWGWTEGSK